ncbi:LamG-like jellyroll fold domain-containing protein [Gracilinema caldarium]|uniref:Fibronectin type III domain protein n=1 Tax=Gracilinema caldarium (strain ATCC 51460 / DSM 7334 / H1) TaxID=744872 RepID=F8F134_GRAC1|nr:LamG-like jellyroll fold domain-containing protein [Gracilinema caldarium]AEJ20824.1 Fibronectin type III domain protein [Gracilinema caldarium DSM 7334]
MKGHCIILFCIASLTLNAEEQVLQLGGKESWNNIEALVGVEIESKIPTSHAIILSSRKPMNIVPDLLLTFDESGPDRFADVTGHYLVTTSSSVLRSESSQARFGSGAALFSGISLAPTATLEQSGLFIKPKPGALFASGSRIEDFTIDFWLYPANVAKGEQILTWSSGRKTLRGESLFQRIRCQVGTNSIEWIFNDFFTSVDDTNRITIYLKGIEKLIPRTWSHHMIRYDANQGSLEYLVNGNVEAIVYTTKSQKPGGEIYTPKIGDGGVFILGERYSGLIDHVRILPMYLETVQDTKYPLSGGYMVSKSLDLGYTDSRVFKIVADVRAPKEGAVPPQVQLFIRTSNNPYQWTDDDFSSWIPIESSVLLKAETRGRYIQIKAHLYPSDTGESTPRLNSISIFYEPDLPPPPPSMVQAIARDGAVELLWKPSPDRDLAGYVVYYGTASGTYFGTDAVLGPSPIDVGLRTSIVIDGLQNGRVYYFSVAAYDKASPAHIGALSREVAGRPLRMER